MEVGRDFLQTSENAGDECVQEGNEMEKLGSRKTQLAETGLFFLFFPR